MLAERSAQISLSGVARLARVQRPVVSMWRSRSKNSDAPFPGPITTDGVRELFDTHAVADWLTLTGRGNNPDALDDATAIALLDGMSDLTASERDAIAALIVLGAVAESPLTSLDADEIVDLADEIDPNDDAVLSEIDAVIGARLEELAHAASAIVDADYSHQAALAEVDARSSNAPTGFGSGTGLRPDGTTFMTRLAHDIIRSVQGVDSESPVIADVTGSATGFAAAFAASLPESSSPVVSVPPSGRTDSRHTLRHLIVNGVGLADITTESAGWRTEERPVLRVATVDGAEDMGALTDIANALADLGENERAFVYGPARFLADADVRADVNRWRAELIRSGQLRAIVKLPRGLIAENPRQSLALWVFAPVPPVPLAQRWTLVADASDREMDAATAVNLIDDVIAALGVTSTLRAHAFAVGRLTRTSTLAASESSLVAVRGALSHTPEIIDRASTRDIPALIDQMLSSLGAFGDDVAQRVTVSGLGPSLRTAEVETLLKDGHLRYVAGTRLNPSEVQSAEGYRVIGPDQVMCGALAEAAFVDRLAFARQHPNAGLTEPGDIVFVSGPKPAAIVDEQGASVVAYPARVLRIDPDDPAGLSASLVAADICRQSSSEWRAWSFRRVVSGQREALDNTLARIDSERRELQARLDALNSLTDLVADGVAAGRITLAPPHEPQPKGTR